MILNTMCTQNNDRYEGLFGGFSYTRISYLWPAPVGRTLRCQQERYNLSNPYAVSIPTVGHITHNKNISWENFTNYSQFAPLKITCYIWYLKRHIPQAIEC